VIAYDPVASAEAQRVLLAEHGEAVCNAQLRIVDSARQAVEGADALVLVTEWKEFRAPDLPFLAEKLASKAVFDGRNIYDPEAFAAAGLIYEGIGRRSMKEAQ
jgi:UDPglucose 6-dehydrogenase